MATDLEKRAARISVMTHWAATSACGMSLGGLSLLAFGRFNWANNPALGDSIAGTIGLLVMFFALPMVLIARNGRVDMAENAANGSAGGGLARIGRAGGFAAAVAIQGALLFVVGATLETNARIAQDVVAFSQLQATIATASPEDAVAVPSCDRMERARERFAPATAVGHVSRRTATAVLWQHGCMTDAQLFSELAAEREASQASERITRRLPYTGSMIAALEDHIGIKAIEWCILKRDRAGQPIAEATSACAAKLGAGANVMLSSPDKG